MPDTGAPWNIPYVAASDLVKDWPTDNQQQAQAISDALDTAALLNNVVQTVKTDTFTTTSGTFVTVTGMTVTITPSSNTHKVLVLLDARINADTSAAAAFARLMRDSTPIYIGDTAGSRTRVLTAAGSPATQVHTSVSGIYLDSPATTSPVTYSLEVRTNTAAGIGVNVAASDTDATNRSRAASSITVIEVAA